MPAAPDPPRPGAVEKHPPERRRRRGEPVVLYSCCCCCCCCLHTVGGAIGAALARGSIPAAGDEDAEAANLPSSQSLFWTSVLMVVGLVAVAAAAFGGDPVSGLVGGGLVMLFVGPLVLLGGCLVMAVRVGANPDLRQFPQYRRDLVRIVLYTLAGTVGGVLVMVAGFVAISGLG